MSPTQSLPLGSVSDNLAEQLDALIETKPARLERRERNLDKINSLRDAACQYICSVTPPVNSTNANCIGSSTTSAKSTERRASRMAPSSRAAFK